MNAQMLDKRIALFAFVMCSSFLMVFGVNLSLLLFLPLLYLMVFGRLLAFARVDNGLKLWTLLFVVGATLSTFNALWEGHTDLFRSALAVYPNYVYWGVILFTFITIAGFHRIDYVRLGRAIALAILAVCVYFYFLQSLLSDNLFFKKFTPNNFSFLLICFMPYTVYYLKKRYSLLPALLILGGIVTEQLIAGRRAGFILILAGGLAAGLVELLRISPRRVLGMAVAIMSVFGAFQTSVVENAIQRGNDRVYELLYGGSESLDTERSYLTRLAMTEKGLDLFSRNKVFGVGLNNFTKVEGHIEGDFEGSEFVIDKDIYTGTSSHNSYINILAEGGLFLIVPFIALLVTLIGGGVRRLSTLSDFEKVVLISVAMMSVHLGFINGIVNSVAWFNLAMLAYIVTRHTRQRARVQQHRAPYPVRLPPPSDRERGYPAVRRI